jgi:hypothetical protein
MGRAMSKRGNWERLRVRTRQERYGSESVTGSTPLANLLSKLSPQPRGRRPPSKAQLRAEAERALREWKGRRS